MIARWTLGGDVAGWLAWLACVRPCGKLHVGPCHAAKTRDGKSVICANNPPWHMRDAK